MRAPKNLTIIVWDNGIYQITGVAADRERPRRSIWLTIARACGIAKAHWAADEDDFDRLRERSAWRAGRA